MQMTVSAENVSKLKTSTPVLNSPLTLMTLSLIAALLLAIAVRIDHHKQTRDEVTRVDSPDGSVSAVVYELSGNAEIPFSYQVGIAARGKVQMVATLAGAMRNDRAYGVNVRWLSPGALSVEYLAAQNQQLLASDVSAGGQKVRVTLQSGVRDESAPPGGMLFNLQQAREDGF